MEDDILPAGSDAQTNETPEVLVNVDLAFNGITSKSGEETSAEGSKETTVSTAVIALVNAKGQIMMIRDADGQIDTDNTLKGIKFLTKVAKDVKAIAIVNTKKANDYLACKTMDDLKKIIEEKVDQEYLVKVGEKADIFKDYKEGSSSTTNNVNTLTVEIPVTQLSARVDLMGIKYSKDSESSYIRSVKFVSAQLININKHSMVYDESSGMVGKEAPTTKTVGDPKSITKDLSQDTWLGNAYGESIIYPPLFTDYSYTKTNKNTSSDPVKMRITYSVNGETSKSVDIVINNGVVEAGTLYRLYVGLKIKNDKVETEVTCYTKDWIKEDIKIEIK